MNEFYALFTGGLVYLPSQLDARWQKEAMQQKNPVLKTDQKPCWEQKGCPPDQVAVCPVAKSAEPRWQVVRASNGSLPQKCLDCQVFRNAPIPTTA